MTSFTTVWERKALRFGSMALLKVLLYFGGLYAAASPQKCRDVFDPPAPHPLDVAALSWNVFPYEDFSRFERYGSLLWTATVEPWQEVYGPHARVRRYGWDPYLEVKSMAELVRFANARMDDLVRLGHVSPQNAIYLGRMYEARSADSLELLLERWDSPGLVQRKPSGPPVEDGDAQPRLMSSPDFFKALIRGHLVLAEGSFGIIGAAAPNEPSYVHIHDLAHFSAFLAFPEYLQHLLPALRRLQLSHPDFALDPHHWERVNYILEGFFVMNPHGEQEWRQLRARAESLHADSVAPSPDEYWRIVGDVLDHLRRYWLPMGGGVRTPNVASGFLDVEPLHTVHVLARRHQLRSPDSSSLETYDQLALITLVDSISALYAVPFGHWFTLLDGSAPPSPEVMTWLRLQSSGIKRAWGYPSL